MSNLRPLGDKIVVQAVERETVTSSGIVLPDSAKEKPQEGNVISVGPGKLLESGEYVTPEVKVGDRIIYSKYSGTEFKMDGAEYLVLSERDVLAIVG